jgi:hypothetical protein
MRGGGHAKGGDGHDGWCGDGGGGKRMFVFVFSYKFCLVMSSVWL